MIGLISRYVLTRVMRGVGLASVVILAMIMLVDFVELNRTLGSQGVGPLRLAGFTALRTPALMEATLPFVFLFGSMWGLSQLNRSSELVVMRASGLSAWRFLAPAAAFAFTAGVLIATAYNPAAARLTGEFERQRQALLDPANARVELSEEGLWLREGRAGGQIVVRADVAKDGGRRLERATLFIYEPDANNNPEFVRRIDAERAELKGGFWQLTEAWETAPSQEPVRFPSLALPTDLEPAKSLDRAAAANTLDFWELRRQSRLLKEAGFSPARYDLRWQELLSAPLALMAMTIVGAAASLRLARKGGAFRLIALAATVGFAAYFIDAILAALGTTGVLPPVAAVWSAPLFTLLGGLLFISVVEDG